uniref:Uncharacterized protein n=1 Tax=Avena sativa TaxID=4498 RepID=A0ACD6A4D3_AVESA
MAISMWQLSAVTLGMTTLSWFVSPLIAFFLPKFLFIPSFNAPQKLRELEFDIIPKLKSDLTKVDELRILGGAKKGDRVRLKSLNKQAGRLRHAVYEAEDIIDLVDYHQIEGKVVCDGESHDNSWLQRQWWVQHLYGAMGHCDGDFLHMSGAQLPMRSAPSVSWVQRSYHWFRSFDFKKCSFGKKWLKKRWRFLARIPGKGIELANYYRNWFGEVVGITNYQDIAVPLDSGIALKKKIEELENLLSEVEKPHAFNLPSNSAQNDIASKTRSITISSPAPTEMKVFGRDTERDNVIKKLNEELEDELPNSISSKCYYVIGICGIAGSGKTTLARHVYDHIKQDGYFEFTMFIHVSETFTVKAIFHDMLKEITNDPHYNIEDCGKLQEELEVKLRGKRFFLVLDDLWVQDDNNEKLHKLLSPLDAGKKGSKILVTSRTNDAARCICADEPMAIPDLEEEQYLSMFMHYALDGSGVDPWLFEPIGRKIAAKLLRSPIAAVTVAGQLRRRPYLNVWETTATLDMLNETRGALWWSYRQLDADTRRCFEYCTIFPRRFKLERKELVRLWLAQGFVKTIDATEDMEDVAEGYIQDLVSCSFLHKEKTGAYTYDTYYFTIHDLLHDLADAVSGSDCFRIEKNGPRWTGDVPLDARHIFIENYDASLITRKILELEHLRSLIIYSVGRHVTVDDNVIGNIFKRLLKLRVLAMPFARGKSARVNELTHLFSLPESISQLKHLRYLAFRGSIVRRVILPSTLAKLYHIQLLDFGHSEKLEFSFAELINLRHVFCEKGVEFHIIGRLISLQTIGLFRVKNKHGYEVTQLRDLNKLRDVLCISGLQNVKSKEEAREANLAAKERLRGLCLYWDRGDVSRNPGLEADVLEGLCPSMELETLNIYRYKGLRYPNWMVGKQSSGPKNLHQLWLSCWSQLGPAPELEAFIHLRYLALADCSWNALPANLVHLRSLETLVISCCMNILSLPVLPLSLEYFEISGCDADLLKSCETFGHPNWHKIVHVHNKRIRSWGTTSRILYTPAWVKASKAVPMMPTPSREALGTKRGGTKKFKGFYSWDVDLLGLLRRGSTGQVILPGIMPQGNIERRNIELWTATTYSFHPEIYGI